MNFERNTRPQDITWFLDQIEAQKLDLSPPFQRNSVWNIKDRQFFVETILLNFPCPAVFLFKDIDKLGKAIYRVIDGKQRLQTIIMFKSDAFRTSDNSTLPIEARNKFFSELNDDFKKTFWNFNIPVEMINTDESATLNNIFDRLNRNNKKLNHQELRNAKYDGEFFSYVEKESQQPFWDVVGLFTKGNISRMEDQQFVAELVIVILEGKIAGFEHHQIDEYYAKFDAEFDDAKEVDEKFTYIKSKLQDINSVNGVIQKKYKTKAAFYSLWAYFALVEDKDQIQDLNEVADRLDRIMNFYKDPEKEVDPDIGLFLNNSKGATTDRGPREKRHAALQSIFNK